IRQGIPGQATILSLAETGMLINDRPVARMTMNVVVPGRPPYVIEHREAVPLIALGMVTPGSTLPVAVDASDPHKLAIDWGGDAAAASAGAPLPNTLSSGGAGLPNTLQSDQAEPGWAPAPVAWSGSQAPGSGFPQMPTITIGGTGVDLSAIFQQLAQAGITLGAAGMPINVTNTSTVIDARPADLAAHLAAMRQAGIPGRATIRTANDLGVAVHGSELVSLGLDVFPESGSGYQAQVTALVPAGSAGRAVVGGGLPVFIDRSNPQNLAIDWDAA
ncbi:MAG: hypothetical protein QOH61_2711, partial [Chloroflexota bacterium]|nr:hypothetical protein [Chloroflexota bacterium]